MAAALSDAVRELELTSGDFDWVLSRIEQDESRGEWASGGAIEYGSEDLTPWIAKPKT